MVYIIDSEFFEPKGENETVVASYWNILKYQSTLQTSNLTIYDLKISVLTHNLHNLPQAYITNLMVYSFLL